MPEMNLWDKIGNFFFKLRIGSALMISAPDYLENYRAMAVGQLLFRNGQLLGLPWENPVIHPPRTKFIL